MHFLKALFKVLGSIVQYLKFFFRTRKNKHKDTENNDVHSNLKQLCLVGLN